MEVAVIVVSVEHKTVSAARVPARIEYRTLLVKLAAQQGAVYSVAIETALHISHIRAVFEILHQRRLRRGVHRHAIGVVSTAGDRAVGHLVGHTDVVHKGSHSIDLRRGACTRQGVGHLRPLVGGGPEVGRQVVVCVLYTIHYAVAGVGVAAVARGGVVVILHHLRRSRSHTARHRTLGLAAIGGAEGVVVRTLIPRSGHQRSHRRVQLRRRHSAVEQLAPCAGKRRRRSTICHLQGRGRYIVGRVALPPPYLLFIAIKERADVLRHILGHEAVLDAVGQHGLHTVVAADENKTALGGSEDVELREGSLCRNILQGSRVLHTLRLEPGLRHTARHILRHRSRHACQREGQQHKKDNRPFHNNIVLFYNIYIPQCQPHAHRGHTVVQMQTYTLFSITATFFFLQPSIHADMPPRRGKKEGAAHPGGPLGVQALRVT